LVLSLRVRLPLCGTQNAEPGTLERGNENSGTRERWNTGTDSLENDEKVPKFPRFHRFPAFWFQRFSGLQQVLGSESESPTAVVRHSECRTRNTGTREPELWNTGTLEQGNRLSL
jgi:hypothetical protein